MRSVTWSETEVRDIATTLRFLAVHFRMENTQDDELNEANMRDFLISLAAELDPAPNYSREEIEDYGLHPVWTDLADGPNSTANALLGDFVEQGEAE